MRNLGEELQINANEKLPMGWFGWTLCAGSWLAENHMVLAYLGVKVLSLCNIVAQILVLDRVISIGNMRYFGWTINWWTNGWWFGTNEYAELFPLLTLCRVVSMGGDPGVLGNHREDHITCNLNVNLWSMKFYMLFLYVLESGNVEVTME